VLPSAGSPEGRILFSKISVLPIFWANSWSIDKLQPDHNSHPVRICSPGHLLMPANDLKLSVVTARFRQENIFIFLAKNAL
jgi:hypothetical protein